MTPTAGIHIHQLGEPVLLGDCHSEENTMAQKVVKIREDASSMSDFDEMLAMTATAAAPADEEDQDTILGEFEEQFAADADQGEDDASQAQPAGANQWPVGPGRTPPDRAHHAPQERAADRPQRAGREAGPADGQPREPSRL